MINFFKKNPYYRFSHLIDGIDTTLNRFQGDWRLFSKAFLLTLCAWITHAFRLILIGYSLNESLPFAQLFLLQPLVSALSIIPITISGLGLVEGGLTLVLAELGIPAAYGLTIALLDRGITTFFHLVVGIKSATKVL